MATAAIREIHASDYNPLLPEVRDDPYPYYAALRREAPVHALFPGANAFAVSRHAEVTRVLHQPETFSSTAIQVALQGGALAINANSGALAGHRLMASPMMIAVDPPHHGRLRRLVNRGFTPRRIGALEPRIRELTAALLDAVVAEGRMELVGDLAIPLPVTVIAELLGIDPDRYEDFKAWSDTLVIGLSGLDGRFDASDVVGAADAMADYLEEIAAERRRAPRDDLISVLVGAEGNDVLSDGEVLSFIVLLLIAGNETTTNLIGNAVRALLAHPDALREICADPGAIPLAIEETLRFDSPIQAFPRLAMRDTELLGQAIPKGSMVMAIFGSANRDEEHFEHADRFDLHRDTRGHVAFGHGIHFCLGSSLARLEARVALEGLSSRCRNLRLADPEIPPVGSLLLRGPARLELAFDPA